MSAAVKKRLCDMWRALSYRKREAELTQKKRRAAP